MADHRRAQSSESVRMVLGNKSAPRQPKLLLANGLVDCRENEAKTKEAECYASRRARESVTWTSSQALRILSRSFWRASRSAIVRKL